MRKANAPTSFDLPTVAQALDGASVEKIMEAAFEHFGDRLLLSTSLSVDDMVLLDHALKVANGRPLRVFTLDTGRLHQETYDVLDAARSHFDVAIEVYAPDTAAVQELVTLHGPNHFRQSVDARKACCFVRKVEPLRRALATADAWVTGMRAAQAVTRANLSPVEFDLANGAGRERPLVKFNPLARWTDAEIWAYAEAHALPVNALHTQGFPSIGCAPCTRAVAPGEDPRAGRWWWESPDTKECGLHARPTASP